MKNLSKQYEHVLGRAYQECNPKHVDTLKTIVSVCSHPVTKFKKLKKLKSMAQHNQCIGQYASKDYSVWHKNFKNLLLSSNESRAMEMVEEFYQNPLELVSDRSITETDPVVVCVLKNEKYRTPEFLKHYRGLGVKNFIIIDNGSDDGTLEYLMEQEDVQLYQTMEIYNSRRKTAWINKAISYNGIHRWYLVPDSDEFFAYPEMQKMDLPEYVAKLQEKGWYGAKTMMLEMYPNSAFFDDDRDPGKFSEDYCYFDGDRSQYRFDEDVHCVYGGFHNRVFPELEEEARMKVSLLYYDGENIELGSHDIYPFYKYYSMPLGGIVLHYKFLANEREKIAKIRENGTYANGSRMYRIYDKKFREDEEFNPYFEGSVKWNNETSFKIFDFINALTERD